MSEFDVNVPSPDEGHEAIRVAVVAAIEELGYTADDSMLGLDLVDTLFVMIEGLLDRVSALESTATPEESPDAV